MFTNFCVHVYKLSVNRIKQTSSQILRLIFSISCLRCFHLFFRSSSRLFHLLFLSFRFASFYLPVYPSCLSSLYEIDIILIANLHCGFFFYHSPIAWGATSHWNSNISHISAIPLKGQISRIFRGGCEMQDVRSTASLISRRRISKRWSRALIFQEHNIHYTGSSPVGCGSRASMACLCALTS